MFGVSQLYYNWKNERLLVFSNKVEETISENDSNDALVTRL